MEKYVIRKYQEDKQIESKIKRLIVNIMTEEQGFAEWKDSYLNENYDRDNLIVLYAQNYTDNVIATMSLDIYNGDVGKLRSVCCHPEYRGLGLSKNLLDGIFMIAKEMNINKIQLDTYSNLERAIAFYNKNGFKKIYEEPYGDKMKYILETAV